MSLTAQHNLNDNAANTTVADVTGNYPGTASQNTADMSVAGKINTALTYNGLSDFTNLGTSYGNVGTGDLSIRMWVNPTSYAIPNTLLVNGDATQATPGGWIFQIGTTGYLRFLIGSDLGSAALRSYRDSSVVIPTGLWTHVTVTWDNSAGIINFYTNAVLTNGAYGNQNGAGRNVDNPYNAYIGANVNRSRNYFTGPLDDVRFDPWIVSHQEILDTVRDGAGTESNPPNEALLGGPIIRQLLRSA